MRNIVLTVSYDGTNFAGFQRQPRQRTVQGVLEEALGRLEGMRDGSSPRITGSGRTDTGVHALRQVVNYVSTKNLPKSAYLKGLNSLLPNDLAVKDMTTASLDFNARKSAKAKEYHYWLRLASTPNPLGFKALDVGAKLDISAMELALEYFRGTYDFAGFKSSGSSVINTVRTMYHTEASRFGAYLVLAFIADGFLYNMVRIIMGTLLDVGRGRTDPASIPVLLKNPQRSNAGPTASAEGLYLYRVYYDDTKYGLLGITETNRGTFTDRLNCHLDIIDYFT